MPNPYVETQRTWDPIQGNVTSERKRVRVTKSTGSWKSFYEANGVMPEKAYSLVVEENWPALVTARRASGDVTPFTVFLHAYGDSLSNLPASDASYVESQAIAKLQNRAVDKKIGLGEHLMEGKKTANSLAGLVRTSASFLGHVKKGNLKGAIGTLEKYGLNLFVSRTGKRIVRTPVYGQKDGHILVRRQDREISSRWEDQTPADRLLEINFCLSPLLADAQELVKGLAYESVEQESFRRRLDTYQIGSGDPVQRTRTLTGYFDGSYYRGDYTWNYTTSATARSSVRITNAMVSANKALGLGDPIKLAYELTYASWLLDYFTNLGDVINGIGAFSGMNYLQGSITRVVKIERSFKLTTLVGSSWRFVRQDTFSTGTEFHLIRVVNSSPPTVGLIFRPLEDLGVGQLANSLAFLAKTAISFDRGYRPKSHYF